MLRRILLPLLCFASQASAIPLVDVVQGRLPASVTVNGNSAPLLHRTSTCLSFLVAAYFDTELRDIDLWVEYEKPRDRSKTELDKLRLTPSLLATPTGYKVYLLSLADDGCFQNSWKLFRRGSKLRLRLRYSGPRVVGKTLWHPVLEYGSGYQLPPLFFQAVRPNKLEAGGYSIDAWPIPVEYDLCNAARKLGWDRFSMGEVSVDLKALCSPKPLEASRRKPCQTLWFSSYEDELECEPIAEQNVVRIALGPKPRDGVKSALMQLARR